MTNRYVINGLLSDMLDGNDIIVLGTPLEVVTNLVDLIEEEIRKRGMDEFIEKSSRRNGDRHIVLADLGSVRALSALNSYGLRGRQADICAVYRNGLNPDQFMRLLGDMKPAVVRRGASGEIIPLD